VNLEEARIVVRDSALQASEETYSDARVDRAIRAALSEFVQQTRCTVTSGTVALTGSVAAFTSTTLSNFRPERIVRAQARYIDRGVWGTGNSYVYNDFVQGDGSPDSAYYICTLAHTSGTSNEPPNGAYWRVTAANLGTPVDLVDLNTVVCNLESTTASDPTMFAFEGTASGYVAPMPDSNRILWVQYYQPLVAWEPGTSNASTITLNVPDEYINDALWYGAASFLESADPLSRMQSQGYKAFKEAIRRVKGEAGLESGPVVKDIDKLV